MVSFSVLPAFQSYQELVFLDCVHTQWPNRYDRQFLLIFLAAWQGPSISTSINKIKLPEWDRISLNPQDFLGERFSSLGV